MRRRSVLVVVVLGLAAACSSPPAPPAAEVEGARPEAPLFTGLPATHAPSPSYDPSEPPPGPPLPEPVVIPRNSYAPEPVMEIGTLEIPAIGLKHRIYQGVTLHNIDRGPSHWTGSAMPGQMGNTVFAGHRATNSQPFRRIEALVPGDKAVFAVDGVRWTYRVTGHLVVKPADSWIADQTHAFTGTLYACHPVGSVAERYVVRFELVE